MSQNCSKAIFKWGKMGRVLCTAGFLDCCRRCHRIPDLQSRYSAAAKYSCPSRTHLKERIDHGVKTPLVDLEASHCAFYSELTAEHGHSLTLG